MKFFSEECRKVVRMAIMVMSGLWWLIFLVGFGMLLTAIKKTAENSQGDSDFRPDPHVVKVVTGPLWMFLVTAPPLYITYILRVVFNSQNIKRVLHCITLFFTFFYTSAAILTITVGIIYMDKNTTMFLSPGVLPSRLVAMKLILIGTSFSVTTFWLGLGLWPLLDIKRSRYRGYTELQESARH